jgi:hypothetical protein
MNARFLCMHEIRGCADLKSGLKYRPRFRKKQKRQNLSLSYSCRGFQRNHAEGGMCTLLKQNCGIRKCFAASGSPSAALLIFSSLSFEDGIPHGKSEVIKDGKNNLYKYVPDC